MNLSIKRLLFLISSIFIYGLTQTAQAQMKCPQSKMQADLFDIQFIMNNEPFTLQRVNIQAICGFSLAVLRHEY